MPDKTADEYLDGACFGYVLNCGDTFAYACADCEPMSDYDWSLIKPIVAEYGYPAFNAYVSLKRNLDVIRERRTPAYLAAREKIEALLVDEFFMDGDELVVPVRHWRKADDPARFVVTKAEEAGR